MATFGFEDAMKPAQDSGAFSFEEAAGQKANPQIGNPQELTFGEKLLQNVTLPAWMDNLRGSVVGGMMQGAADPVVGAVQFGANLLPDATGIPQAVNKRITEQNQQYEDARAQAGRSGADVARLVGNVASPANLAIAARVPAATTTLGRAAVGAGVGALTSAMQPVEDASNGYALKKGLQIGTGALTGAILTPLMGAIGDAVVRKLAPSPGVSPEQVDGAIAASLRDAGQTLDDIPPEQLAALREQVNGALQVGKQIDPAALARKADFEALGIEPTLGQLTRDPMQFAREQNLRGVEGVGEPLSARFAQQGMQLQDKLAAPAAGAQDAYNAGTALSDSLKGIDEQMRQKVSNLYAQARNSTGKDLEIPLTGLAQDYAQVLSDFGDRVPGAIRSKFAALGLDPMNPTNQKQVFTLENADSLLKTINAHVGNDPATNRALGGLRSALRSAITGADASGGPFAPAVKAAAERFQLQDAVPALKAASRGTVAPDDFVKRFVINGKTNDVKGLSQVLQQSDPAAWQEARAQIADTLRLAAFGENAGADAPFLASSYMKQVRRLGVDKLSAFFSPQEVQDILRVGRVGTLIKKAPNAAAVSSSNSQIGLINVLAPLNVLGRVARVGKHMVGAVQQDAHVANALAANVPMTNAPLTPAQKNYLAYILAGGGVAGGATGGAVQ